jgi:hypothetical protein
MAVELAERLPHGARTSRRSRASSPRGPPARGSTRRTRDRRGRPPPAPRARSRWRNRDRGHLREVARVRDVEHLAFGVLELFEGQRRLAAAGAADDDQRRRLAIDRLLRVVEGDRLVEQMNRRPFRVQVAHRLGFADRRRRRRCRDPALVDRRAAQEARLVVIVIGDHLEHQRADLVAVANQREQQPVGVVEAGAVELAVAEIDQLLDLRGAKSPRAMASATLR